MEKRPGDEVAPDPISYHGGGINLRVLPRVNLKVSNLKYKFAVKGLTAQENFSLIGKIIPASSFFLYSLPDFVSLIVSVSSSKGVYKLKTTKTCTER